MKFKNILSFLIILVLIKFSQNDTLMKMLSSKRFSLLYEIFSNLIQKDEFFKALILTQNLTVFAPNNDAFKDNKKLINPLAYIVKGFYFPTYTLVKSRKLFTYSYADNPVFVNLVEGKNGEKFTYANGAKILNFYRIYYNECSQALYEIDQLIDVSENFPTIEHFLNNSKHDIARDFYHIFEELSNFPIYNRYLMCLDCTFFIPKKANQFDIYHNILDALMPKKEIVLDNLMNKVFMGHVIPNNGYFMRSMQDEATYGTLLNNHVQVELKKEERPEANRTYIYAQSTGNDDTFPLGTTRSSIIEADILTPFGVVHFIDKPLIFPDILLEDYLNEETTGNIKQFLLISKKSPVFKNFINTSNPFAKSTVFAFTDEAFQSVSDKFNKMLSNDPEAAEKIIKLHFRHGAISTHSRKQASLPKIEAEESIKFEKVRSDMLVSTGGTIAKIVERDILTKNGIIHIIDKVLGMPVTTITERLREDPKFATTFRIALTNYPEWLKKLDKKTRNFTLFAPSETAWKKFQRFYPSYYKQLNNGLYSQNAKLFLDRHLLSNQYIKFSDLRELVKKNKSLKTDTAEFKITEKDIPFYLTNKDVLITIHWQFVRANISHVENLAVNGIIHELDNIILIDKDMKVTDTGTRCSSTSPLLIYQIVFILFIIFITLN